MKNVLILLVFLSLSVAGFSQENSTLSNITKTEKTLESNTSSESTTDIASKAQAKAQRINHKKSNAIISIKAYRKSLQIKTKTVKLC